MEKQCKYCEKVFTINHKAQKYCSEECRKKGEREVATEYQKCVRQKQGITKSMKPQAHFTINEIMVEARKDGLTYGQYVAKYGL